MDYDDSEDFESPLFDINEYNRLNEELQFEDYMLAISKLLLIPRKQVMKEMYDVKRNRVMWKDTEKALINHITHLDERRVTLQKRNEIKLPNGEDLDQLIIINKLNKLFFDILLETSDMKPYLIQEKSYDKSEN